MLDRATRLRRYTNQQILDILRAAVRDGVPPSTSRWREERRLPTVDTVIARFGSWSAALAEADFALPPASAWCRRRRAAVTARVEAALRRALAERGRAMTMREWDGAGFRPKALAVARRFGGWRAAWAAVGAAPPPGRRVTREAALAALRAAVADGGGPVTQAAWRRDGKRPCPATIRNLFGSWAAAWRAALGIDYRPRHSRLERALAGIGDPDRLRLTARQREVLAAILAGEPLARIAARLGVSRERVRQLGEAVRRKASGEGP